MLQNMVVSWVMSRMKEPSTWAGIAVSLGTAMHVTWTADAVTNFTNLGIALAGLVAVVAKDGATVAVKK
jgi:anaerobic glycerol-3-phosphate dehydrogenase